MAHLSSGSPPHPTSRLSRIGTITRPRRWRRVWRPSSTCRKSGDRFRRCVGGGRERLDWPAVTEADSSSVTIACAVTLPESRRSSPGCPRPLSLDPTCPSWLTAVAPASDRSSCPVIRPACAAGICTGVTGTHTGRRSFPSGWHAITPRRMTNASPGEHRAPMRCSRCTQPRTLSL